MKLFCSLSLFLVCSVPLASHDNGPCKLPSDRQLHSRVVTREGDGVSWTAHHSSFHSCYQVSMCFNHLGGRSIYRMFILFIVHSLNHLYWYAYALVFGSFFLFNDTLFTSLPLVGVLFIAHSLTSLLFIFLCLECLAPCKHFYLWHTLLHHRCITFLCLECLAPCRNFYF